jgi:hypothetical protein
MQNLSMRVSALRTAGRTAWKNTPRAFPRNLLISLDSDERIQGNPRKSNTQNGGIHRETASRQENPNGPAGAMSRPPLAKGASHRAILKPLLSYRKRDTKADA